MIDDHVAGRLTGQLNEVLKAVPDPRRGLPEPVFDFALKITPMVNVDLLVRDGEGRSLLTWREDDWGQGWHIPGSIIRVDEPVARRIAACAEAELTATVEADGVPLAMTEFRTARGHFFSLLFLCRLTGPIRNAALLTQSPPRPGALAWHRGVPDRLYPAHGVYEAWLSGSELPPGPVFRFTP